MEKQSFENHVRWVPIYHFLLTGIVAVALVGAGIDLYRAVGRGSGRIEAATLLLLAVAAAITVWYVRIFPLKAQDRAIRAEENLRHYALTGELLDPRLTTYQVVALRFASDAELPALARRAAEEGLSPTAVKQAVEHWRADLHRV